MKTLSKKQLQEYASKYLELSQQIKELTKMKSELSALFKSEVEESELIGGYLIERKEVARKDLDKDALSKVINLSDYQVINYYERLTVKAVK